jgi:hypothetical protein
MTRQSWRSFKNFMGFKNLPKSAFPEMHFIYQLEPYSKYPRVHLICQYTDDFVNIDFHIDIAEHTPLYRDPILMRFHKTMNDYKIMYHNLSRLKQLRDKGLQNENSNYRSNGGGKDDLSDDVYQKVSNIQIIARSGEVGS